MRIGDLRSARTPHQGQEGKDIVVLDRWAEDRTEGTVSSLARSRPVSVLSRFPLGPAVTACQHYCENCSFSRDVMRQSSPAAEVERREILLEGLIDMGSCALHDRLEPAEPHRDQLPNTGLPIRPFVDHREPLCLVRAQRQNDPSSGFDLIEDRRRQSLGGGRLVYPAQH